jgi:hypothetical protein
VAQVASTDACLNVLLALGISMVAINKKNARDASQINHFKILFMRLCLV